MVNECEKIFLIIILITSTSIRLLPVNGYRIANSTTQTNDTDDRNLRQDETDVAIINDQVDFFIQHIWPIALERGYSVIVLPDMQKSVAINAVLFKYMSGIFLTNGKTIELDDMVRYGTATMRYQDDQAFHLVMSFMVGRTDFQYDFFAQLMPVSENGFVEGSIYRTVVTIKFSIGLKDANVKLHDMRIISFDDIKIRILTTNSITSWVSGLFAKPLTTLFSNQIKTTISAALRNQTETIFEEANRNDGFHLKLITSKLVSFSGVRTDLSSR